eukprot:20184-Heterococcus_DN1.PRE.1
MHTTAGSASRKRAEQEAAVTAAAVTEKAVTQPVAAAVTPVIETPLLPPLEQLRALIASSKGQGGGIDVEHVRSNGMLHMQHRTQQSYIDVLVSCASRAHFQANSIQ